MQAPDIDLEISPTLTPSTLAHYATGGQWKLYRHLAILEEAFLELLFGDEYDVLIVSFPPQHGKSEYLSGWGLKYVMGHFPRWRIALVSYSAQLAKKWGESARNFFQEHGRELFGMDVSKDRRAADNWTFDAACYEGLDEVGFGRGGMVTTGTRGTLTGQPVDFGIIDDPIKNADEAKKPAARERLIEWYTTVFLTRLSRFAKHVVIATRWNEEDLSGYIKANRGSLRVRVLNMPALAVHEDEIPEEERHEWFPDPLGRQPGEPLCPELHPLKQLHEHRAVMSDDAWDCIYQGNPRPRKGNWVSESQFRWYHYDELPIAFDTRNQRWYYKPGHAEFDVCIETWDTKLSRKKAPTTGSFVVGLVMARLGARVYVLDCYRKRVGVDETIEAEREMHRRWPIAKVKLFEGKASGPEIVERLEGEIPGMQLWPVLGDKETRAFAEQHWISGGNIYLPVRESAEWVREFLRELIGFPKLKHNDQVDAFTQGLAYFRSTMYGGGGARKDKPR